MTIGTSRSADGELPRLSGRLAEDQDVPQTDRSGDVPRDDLAPVAAGEHPDLDLGRLARHPRAADQLDHLGGGALLLDHRPLPRRAAHFFRLANVWASSSRSALASPGSTTAMLAADFER